MTPKAISFSRTSSSSYLETRQDTSRQVEDIQHYADINGITIVKSFQEHQSGGLSNKCRPLLQEALTFCLDNHIDLILCSELSRLSRKCDELLETIKYLKDNHINCYFLKEQLSIFTPEGKENPYLTIMCAVLGTAAELEREAIHYRLNSGRERYIRLGGKLGKPKGSGIKTKDQMSVQYRSVIKNLKAGQSIRNTSKITGVSPATVQKVKRVFAL